MGNSPFQIPSNQPSQGSAGTVQSTPQSQVFNQTQNPVYHQAQTQNNQRPPSRPEVPHSTINFDYPQQKSPVNPQARQQRPTASHPFIAPVNSQPPLQQFNQNLRPAQVRPQTPFNLSQKKFTPIDHSTPAKVDFDETKKGFIAEMFSILTLNPAYAMMGLTLVLSIAGVGVGLAAAQNPNLQSVFQNVATDQAKASEPETFEVSFGTEAGDGVTNTFVEPQKIPYKSPKVVEDEFTKVLYDEVCGLNISYPRVLNDSEVGYEGYPLEVEGFVGGYKFSNQNNSQVSVFCGQSNSFANSVKDSFGLTKNLDLQGEEFCLQSSLAFDSCGQVSDLAVYANQDNENLVGYQFTFDELVYLVLKGQDGKDDIARISLQIDATTKPNFGGTTVEILD